jgi:hypothetical protein
MRLGTLAALAVGYVLGSRAGRDRYEQLRTAAGEAAHRLETYGSTGPLATWLESNVRDGARSDTAAGRGQQPR